MRQQLDTVGRSVCVCESGGKVVGSTLANASGEGFECYSTSSTS